MWRDLEKDLTTCNGSMEKIDSWIEVLFFVADARKGWPYAIKRTLEAEKQVDQLQHEIRMLQDQLNNGRC